MNNWLMVSADTFTAARTEDARLFAPHGLAIPTIAAFSGLALVIAANVGLALGGVTPLWLGCLVNAVALYYLAHVNHEAVHRNISGADAQFGWLNETIGHLGSFWLFLPFPAFRAVHLAHHRLTNHPTLDGDMWFARKSWPAVALSCFTILVGYEIRLRRLHRMGLVSRNTMSVILLTRLLYVALVLLAMVTGFAAEVLMLMVLPAILVMPVLAFLFAFVVHHPHDSQEKLTASNVLLSRNSLKQKFITGLFLFQNYHLVHHLRPRLPFYRYGAAYRQMARDLAEKGAAIRFLD